MAPSKSKGKDSAAAAADSDAIFADTSNVQELKATCDDAVEKVSKRTSSIACLGPVDRLRRVHQACSCSHPSPSFLPCPMIYLHASPPRPRRRTRALH